MLHDTFALFYNSAFTPIGHNRYSAPKRQKMYFEEDLICANLVRFLCLSKSSIRDLDVESMIYTAAAACLIAVINSNLINFYYKILIFMHLYTSIGVFVENYYMQHDHARACMISSFATYTQQRKPELLNIAFSTKSTQYI